MLGLNLWTSIAQLSIYTDLDVVSLLAIASKLQKGLYNNGDEFEADMVKMYHGLDDVSFLSPT
jgi:hypothetical protein